MILIVKCKMESVFGNAWRIAAGAMIDSTIVGEVLIQSTKKTKTITTVARTSIRSRCRLNGWWFYARKRNNEGGAFAQHA